MSDFLQSQDWFDFQRSLGRPVFEYDKEGIKAGIIKLPLPFKKSYLYIPHGPEVPLPMLNRPLASRDKVPEWTADNFGLVQPHFWNKRGAGLVNFRQGNIGIGTVNNFVTWLRDLAKKEKAIFIKAEPLSDSVVQTLAEHKFKKSKKEIQPSKTVILDLSKSESELLDAMHHKTRYNIKVAEKNGITVRENGDFESFWKLMKKTSKRDKFSSHPKDYYEKLLNFFHEGTEIISRLNLAYYKDEPVAGLILLAYKDTAYYLHGVSDYEYRSLMAPYKLHWEIIKKLKLTWAPCQNSDMVPMLTTSHRFYDFWGIDSKKWPGVTRFKLGWGGQTVEHPGSFDMTISKLWYLGYKIAKKLKTL